jgi:plasmid stabilization system protein ParE
MSYQVRVLARARQDVEDIVAWIAERSTTGAERWVSRFEEALATLERNPLIAPLAPESEDLGEEVRHLLFRTRAGRTYRALFLVVGDEVRVLRVRGPGQAPVTRHDLEP